MLSSIKELIPHLSGFKVTDMTELKSHDNYIHIESFNVGLLFD